VKLIVAMDKVNQELLIIVLQVIRIKLSQIRLSSSKLKRNKRKYFVTQNTAELFLL